MKKLVPLCFMILFGFVISFLEAQTISYDHNNHTFSIENLDLPTAPAGAKNPPYWKYFWKFGDGHYSMSENPKYCYENPADHEVEVSLTPYYSYDKSQTFSDTLIGSTSCSIDRSYQESSGLVQITSNADGELVPGHEIDLVLDYKLPTGATSGEGYLLFFYNSENEQKDLNLPFYPLWYSRQSERLFNATKMDVVIASEMTNISAGAQTYVRNLQNDFQYKGFECSIQSGEVSRVFLTVAANEALDTTIIKGKKGALNISMKAVWIPKNVQFDLNTMVDNYSLQLLSVHDPNRLRIVKPYGAAFYNQGNPATLEYKIEFQNKGGRAVKKVDIVVPLNRNLDYETIEITRRDPDESVCPVCPDNFDSSVSTSSCFLIDTSRAKTAKEVTFTFYNVMIHGKNESGVDRSKYTKGFIQYSIKTNKKRTDRQYSRAKIKFGAGEEFTTRPDSKSWRHKSIGLKAGKNFGSTLDGYENLNDEIGRWYNVGLVYKNAPLFQGIGYGVELGSSGFGFRSWTLDNKFDLESFELTEEVLEFKTLDLQAQIEYRIAGIVSIGVGAGLSVPAFGSGDVTYLIPDNQFLTNEHWMYSQNPELIDRTSFEELLALPGIGDQVISKFGLLDSKETTKIGETDISSKTKIGSILNAYVETGFLTGFSIGGRYDYRVYPNSYKQQCLKVSNAELYLRINLNTMK